MSNRRALRSTIWLISGLGFLIWLGLAFSDELQTKLLAISVGGDFTLTSADGPVSTESMRGKVLLVYFGYTFCPDVCPTTLADVAAALRQLSPDELEQTRVLFVSVDPERDTPARLKEYTGYFHPEILGVTGSAVELSRVVGSFRATFAKRPLESGEGYSVDHPGSVYVIAPNGQLFAVAPHGCTIREFVSVIRAARSGANHPFQKEKE